MKALAPKKKGQSTETKDKAKAKAAAAKAKAKAQSQQVKDTMAENNQMIFENTKLEAKFKAWKKTHKTHQLSTSYNASGGFKQNKRPGAPLGFVREHCADQERQG